MIKQMRLKSEIPSENGKEYDRKIPKKGIIETQFDCQ